MKTKKSCNNCKRSDPENGCKEINTKVSNNNISNPRKILKRIKNGEYILDVLPDYCSAYEMQ